MHADDHICEGETVEVDGAYFGGHVKPANFKENRRDRRKAENQTGKRQVVVVARERGGNTLPAVFKSEAAARGWIIARVSKDTKLMPTKRRPGTICTPSSKLAGSTMASSTAT